MNTIVSRKFLLVGGAVLAVILLGGLLLAIREDTVNNAERDVRDIDAAIESLPKVTGSHPPMRLKAGLLPPTNKWFSSVVFSRDPQPVFAYPLSYKPGEEVIGIGLPAVRPTEQAVFASHTDDILVSHDAVGYELVRYDGISMTLAYKDEAGEALFETTLVQGSPYVFFKALRNTNFGVNFNGQTKPGSFGAVHIENEGKRFGIRKQDGELSVQGQGVKLDLSKNQHFAVYAIPQDSDAEAYDQAAENYVASTRVSMSMEGQALQTTYELITENEKPTLFALMPHFGEGGTGQTEGAFNTLYGEHVVRKGNKFTLDTSLLKPATKLSLDRLDEDERQQLMRLVTQDTKTLALDASDTYFGAKQLYRAANLLDLAGQLDMSAEEKVIKEKLRASFDDWFDADDASSGGRHFYYDTTIKSVVGNKPAFGSEQLNDHHFHYGYFIYAAAVLARYDDDFAAKYKPMVGALIEDIAGFGEVGSLPRLRVFDTYTGHSWASGYGDFADGNNQESSSEAVLAWYASYLWSLATQDDILAERSLWLYSLETTAAKNFWLEPVHTTGEVYEPELVSIVWGGKRDSTTFFSPEPRASLGIQLIPMSPGHDYLRGTDDSIREAHLEWAQAEGDLLTGQFADYLIMYKALSGKEAALEAFGNLQLPSYDSANSSAYTYAWITTQLR